jgi:hypothetical protein
MELKIFIRRLLNEIEKKNSWGKNELKNLIMTLMLEDFDTGNSK